MPLTLSEGALGADVIVCDLTSAEKAGSDFLPQRDVLPRGGPTVRSTLSRTMAQPKALR